MRIIELNIVEFGGLSDKHLTLGAGLNVFEGDNEVGKSTVWLFIKFMLYGMQKKGHPEREKSVSRLSHRAIGSMVVLHEGEKYRIERSFSESSRGKVDVYRERDGERVFVGEEVGEAMLGVPREVFESSCGIGQMMCAGVGGEKGIAAIRNLLSSADESVDVEKIIKRLENIRVMYRHRRGEGGKLYELGKKINEAEGRLSAATDSRLRIADIEEKLKKNSAISAENETLLHKTQDLIDQIQKIEILRRFDALRANEERLEAAVRDKEKLVATELRTDYMPSEADVANLSMLSDSLLRAESAVSEAQDRYEKVLREARYSEEYAEVGKTVEARGGSQVIIGELRRAKRAAGIGVALSVLGAIGAGVGAVLTYLLHTLVLAVIPAVLALSFAGGLVLCLTSRKKARKIAEEYSKRPSELEAYVAMCESELRASRAASSALIEASAARDSARSHAERIAADLQFTMKKTAPESASDAAGARAEASRLSGFIARLREIESRAEKLSGVVQNDRSILSVYNEGDLRENISISTEDVTEELIADAEKKRRFYSERAKTLHASDNALRTELINLKAMSEDPAAIADSLEKMRAEYREGESYYEALVCAIDGISAASAAMQGNITPVIAKNAGKMMEYVSDGKYGELKMGNTLEVSLVGKEGLTTSSDMMSGGTKDVAYISLRIALMMQIFGSELPPLMMDESLCQLDDGRMRRILSLVGKLCESQLQCLLFTCHKRESQACLELGISATVVEM